MQKILTFFQQKISAYLSYLRLNFNEKLTNDVVNFEQPGPDLHLYWLRRHSHVTVIYLDIFQIQTMGR